MSNHSLITIFGGKASIHLKHDGDIASLAQKLSKGLIMPDFYIAPSECPPYEVVASLEVLGWELWLESVNGLKAFPYCLRMQTEYSDAESISGNMYDLSPWLARYVSLLCKVDSLVAGTQVMFVRGEARPVEKEESIF